MDPRAGRDSLAVPAVALVGVWAAGALLIGLELLVRSSLRFRSDSALSTFSGLYFIVLLATANIVVGGLVLGVIAGLRTKPRAGLRALTVGVVVTGGVVAQWLILANANDPTHFSVTQERRSAPTVELCCIAVAVVLVTAVLLRVVRRPSRR
jgi:hypothetical protein